MHSLYLRIRLDETMFLLEVKISRQFIKNNRLFRLCTNVHAGVF